MSSQQYKKSAYANNNPFTNDELTKIINEHDEKVQAWEASGSKGPRPKSWMVFDTKTEKVSENMKENGIRYIHICVAMPDGSLRPLKRKTFPTITRSKVSYGKTTKGKKPNKTSFSTRILTLDQTPEALRELAEKLIKDKFPNLTGDEFKSEVDRQVELYTKEAKQWDLEIAINNEFLTLLNDPDVQAAIDYNMEDKMDNKGNVQTHRKPQKDNPDDKKYIVKKEKVPLEQPIVRFMFKHNESDLLIWAKLWKFPKDAKSPPEAITMPDITGKRRNLTSDELVEYLRPGSVWTGTIKYQLCLSSYGARMHAQIQTAYIRRAAKGEYTPSLDEETAEDFDEVGHVYGGGDEDDFESEMAAAAAAPPKDPNVGKEVIVNQLKKPSNPIADKLRAFEDDE